MADKKTQEPAAIVGKAYDFVLWLLPKVERFPKSCRFSVGQLLVTNGLEMLMSLVQSSYTTDKAALLASASAKTNTIRYLLRLSKDLRLITVDSYGFSTGEVEEIGRMVGGWQKATAKRI